MFPITAKAALDYVEIQALAKATAEECERNATFRKYVLMAINAQGATSLAAVVAVIAVRRLIRYDVLPIPEEIGKDNLDGLGGAFLSAMATGQVVNPNVVVPQATTSVEA
jgi:hypothetical protein